MNMLFQLEFGICPEGQHLVYLRIVYMQYILRLFILPKLT